MSIAHATPALDFGSTVMYRNLSAAQLVEHSIRRDEAQLAANGALAVDTGERTGRSPSDKFLEDTPGIHDNIDWGKVNQAITPENFARLEALANEHMASRSELFRFDGYAGADPNYRLRVSVVTEKAWHCLFAKTLFINADRNNLADFDPDWTIINACELSIDDYEQYGLNDRMGIIQSLEQRKVIIFGTVYAGRSRSRSSTR